MLIESIVVPAISETINLSSLINLLIKVDLPALGLPITAILLPSGYSSFSLGSFPLSKALSSVIFKECSALTSISSLIPLLDKS